MSPIAKSTNTLELFYSYAHEDEALRNELEKHLSILQRQGIIMSWYDRQIMPGTDWAQNIDDHLNVASIILLLISPDFLASDYCYQVEMQRALERHRLGEARVIPVLLRPVDWHEAPFANLQCLPRNEKPVTEWDNRDAAFRDIAMGIRTTIEYFHKPSTLTYRSSVSPASRQHRERLLKRVHAFWINGVLEQSLHHVALIELGLQEQPDAVENPWRLIMQESDLPSHPLDFGTRIIQAYDDADGELLILGEPGAGKTTLLLDLARDLLHRAERDNTHPIPVVFNLSSWALKRQPFISWLSEKLHLKRQPFISWLSEKLHLKRQPLISWLVDELQLNYQVPRKVGKAWVSADQVLPLLDGLDEVAFPYRASCVEAINTFRQEHSLLPLVVCSRSEDFLALKQRMLLRSAVVVQPLTEQQVDKYLSSAGEQMEAIRMALQDDPVLRELAITPLLLSVMTLAYHGISAEDLAVASSFETRRQRLFADYVTAMLHRRGAETHYSVHQTISWLSWLAYQLVQHNQTEFYIEQLQRDWLPDTRLRIFYYVVIGLVVGLAIGLVVGLLGWLVGELAGGLAVALVSVLAFGLSGLVYGLLSEQPSLQIDESLPRRPNQRIYYSGWNTFRSGLLEGLVCGLTFGLILGLAFGLTSGLFVLISGLLGGLLGDLLTGGVVYYQRFILRWFLWRAGSMPRNYPRFLDYAAEHILLHKVGDGYIFVHQLLLEYFASLTNTPLNREEK